jgi:hypothetical protein
MLQTLPLGSEWLKNYNPTVHDSSRRHPSSCQFSSRWAHSHFLFQVTRYARGLVWIETSYFRIERGYAQPTKEEAQKIKTALRDLIAAKDKLMAMARKSGCPELLPSSISAAVMSASRITD